MYLTGFADEAASGIDGQIRATQELGWEHIESRNINGTNIHNISDVEFDIVCGKLSDAGVTINCFGSEIANSGKQITEPFNLSLETARRAISRMQRLGTKMIRIMSFAVLQEREPDDQMEEERFRRLRELHTMFVDAGITPVHENCINYGGMGWTYTLRLIENVPGLKLAFDVGNPLFSTDYTQPEPRPKQSSWEFYRHVKEHIAYVHIKDGCYIEEIPGSAFPKVRYTFPGDGDGDVRRIVKDLLDSGYYGGFSIEPHMGSVFHDNAIQSADELKYANYVEYGRRFMKLIEDVHQHELAGSNAGETA
ncbi:MAG: sugar phosphate isomerase/epimerase [Victivallaceae bacterium]|nr:sugar phosphate isomerase/epimerase [Victivallaceae bacterium]